MLCNKFLRKSSSILLSFFPCTSRNSLTEFLLYIAHRQIFRTANDVQFNFQGRGWRPDRDGTAASSNSGHEFCHIQAFCRGTSGKLGGSTLVAGVGEAKRIFHRSPRLISAHAGAPCSPRKYTVYIYGTRIFSSCVCGRRRQGGCVRATHTGCPPGDHSFPSFNLSLSSKLSRIPSSCRPSVAPRTNRFINGEGGNSLSLSLLLFLLSRRNVGGVNRQIVRGRFEARHRRGGGGEGIRAALRNTNISDSTDLQEDRGDRCAARWRAQGNGTRGLIA